MSEVGVEEVKSSAPALTDPPSNPPVYQKDIQMLLFDVVNPHKKCGTNTNGLDDWYTIFGETYTVSLKFNEIDGLDKYNSKVFIYLF